MKPASDMTKSRPLRRQTRLGRGQRLAVRTLMVALAFIGAREAAGAVIPVTTVEQKIGSYGGCSLQEAIYSANFDRNVAIAGYTGSTPNEVTTPCVPGSGDDIIVLPAGAVLQMNRIVDDAMNPTGPTATPIITSTIMQAERSCLEGLQWRASLANSGDRDSLLANPDAIALPVGQIADGHVFVAERDGVIVGFAAILPRPDGNAELDALVVEPSLWKRGVGRLLVEHCADAARGRASRILHVVGNPHAKGFYAACGFRTTGTVETRFGAGLAMQRKL